MSSPATRSVAAPSSREAPRQLSAAEVQRRVVLPRSADPTVHRDHRARSVVERTAGDRPGGACRERELAGAPWRDQPA